MAKILVIDDAQSIRAKIRYFLEDETGHEVIEATDGANGLDILKEDSSFDLIICDVNMPIMDGYTLIQKVREMEQYTDIPIVIVTTEKEASDKEKGFAVGADIYLVKPVQKEELQEKLQMLLEDN